MTPLTEQSFLSLDKGFPTGLGGWGSIRQHLQARMFVASFNLFVALFNKFLTSYSSINGINPRISSTGPFNCFNSYTLMHQPFITPLSASHIHNASNVSKQMLFAGSNLFSLQKQAQMRIIVNVALIAQVSQ